MPFAHIERGANIEHARAQYEAHVGGDARPVAQPDFVTDPALAPVGAKRFMPSRGRHRGPQLGQQRITDDRAAAAVTGGERGFAAHALAQIGKLEAVGVVSALSDAEEVSEIVEALGTMSAKRLIVTGVDLTRRMGAITAAACQSVPLAHVTQSPFVAGGLESPTSLSLARLLLDEQRSAQ